MNEQKPAPDFSGIQSYMRHTGSEFEIIKQLMAGASNPKVEAEPITDPVFLTDGDERFAVPRKYAAAILKAAPALRYSFEHLGGVGHGRD